MSEVLQRGAARVEAPAADRGAARWLLARRDRSPFGRVVRALRRDRAAMLGLVLFAIIVLAALFADQIAPYSPALVHPRERLQRPSATYLLGTDELGRDVLSRII